MIIIFFGPPGTGKSHVGSLFAKKFSLTFYDGDTDYTPEEKNLIASGLWNDEHRRAFLQRISRQISQIATESPNGVVVPIAMTKQWMRDFFNETLTDLHWVLVKPAIPQEQLEEKVISRNKEGHMISVESFRRLTNLFEQPNMPHLTLENPHNPKDTLALNKEMDNIWSQIK